MPPRRKGRYAKKSTTKRRKNPALNLKTLGFSYLQAEILCKNIFGVSLPVFLGLQGHSGGSGWTKTGDPHNLMITLKEIFQGSQVSSGVTIQAALERNLKTNWFNMGTSMIGLMAAQKMLPKTGIPRQFNAISKMLGTDRLVRM